mgnify:CR=1 FL=1
MGPDGVGANSGDSLCWSCLRVGWECLCCFPADIPDGVVVEIVIDDDGEKLRIVRECPFYWQEGLEDWEV